MALFRAETRAKIRRRIGYLLYGSEFLYGAMTDVSPTTFTLLAAARQPDDYYVGRVAYFLETGEALSVSASENGSGILTVNPAFNTIPTIGTAVEVWSESNGIDEVNDAINTAINDVSDQSPVRAHATVSVFAGDRKSFDLPEEWTHLSGMTWAIGETIERPTYVTDRGRFQAYSTYPVEYTVQDHTVYFPYALPSSVASVQITGYRLPNELTADADVCEVRSDYVVYKAASLLQMDEIGTTSTDPDAHSQRGSGWLSHAEAVRTKMRARWDSNTIALE